MHSSPMCPPGDPEPVLGKTNNTVGVVKSATSGSGELSIHSSLGFVLSGSTTPTVLVGTSAVLVSVGNVGKVAAAVVDDVGVGSGDEVLTGATMVAVGNRVGVEVGVAVGSSPQPISTTISAIYTPSPNGNDLSVCGNAQHSVSFR